MGRHSEWRKQVKKLRRKRIRQKEAEYRDYFQKKEQEEREKSPRYQQWLQEQEALKVFEQEEEKRISLENERKWLEREKEIEKQWKLLQEKLAHIKEERRKQEQRIQQEWEEEQRKINELKEKREQERKEKERIEQEFQKQIDDYVTYGGNIPEELKTGTMETNPGKQPCPFFKKTGVCRFGDGCSRNHIRPKVSTILLFPNFYSHISLEQSNESEYGSDSLLEYDNREIRDHFDDFFNDVLPELQKHGCVVQFRVCCNKEAHLRGNAYVEYMSPRDSIRAYRNFMGRWYGGKQLNVEFCDIPSWKQAICGMSFKNKCPKGSACNFLHVFKNPNRMFEDLNLLSSSREEERDLKKRNDMDYMESSRNWRWSVSPDKEINCEFKNGHRNYSPERQSERSSERKERRSSRSHRSKSPIRSKRKKRPRSRSHHRKHKASSESKNRQFKDRKKSSKNRTVKVEF